MLHSPDGNFSAWITIEGVESSEYRVKASEEQMTVTCWIASELGKNFSVNWTNHKYEGVIKAVIKMDGHNCGGTIMKSNTAFSGLPKSTSSAGVVQSGNQTLQALKPFMFSLLELTDDDSELPAGPSGHENLGIIELDMFPIEIKEENVGPPPGSTEIPKLTVHERSIKTRTTEQILLANTQVLPKPAVFVSTRIIGSPLVTFRFKYRPMDVLRANGIAPALQRTSPTPQRAPTPDEELAQAEEEARDLRERLKASEEKLANLKKRKPNVKSEPDEDVDLKRMKKKVKLEEVEVIDLT
ncbi:hypothetical protein FB45DRAFT_891344 [Roridomyces roridus]|uniref:DUF7918 domain-containing protein n=1 Tax=Roridomyces roridus TaxID=1738132 RepID=A0AAD7CE30_9AGAR|nr:hypothetical protein FB45DRAFT_891344 [Roridomyces roridus]